MFVLKIGRRRESNRGSTKGSSVLQGLLNAIGFIAALGTLIAWFRGACRRPAQPRPRRRPSPADCQPVPSHTYRRPDPLIYDQYYLMGLGFPVTWDNPDIRIERAGVAVDPHNLQPDTEYEVVAQVWNGSSTAPAIGLPPLSPHAFRHGHATHALKLAKDVADLNAISMNLGHSSLTITDSIYAVLSDTDMGQGIAQLGRSDAPPSTSVEDVVKRVVAELATRK